MADHTPEPWICIFDPEGGYDGTRAGYRIMAPGTFREICTVEVNDWRIEGEANWEKRHSQNEKAEADARLIRAAPKLLKACQEALRDLSREYNTKDMSRWPGWAYDAGVALKNGITEVQELDHE